VRELCARVVRNAACTGAWATPAGVSSGLLETVRVRETNVQACENLALLCQELGIDCLFFASSIQTPVPQYQRTGAPPRLAGGLDVHTLSLPPCTSDCRSQLSSVIVHLGTTSIFLGRARMSLGFQLSFRQYSSLGFGQCRTWRSYGEPHRSQRALHWVLETFLDQPLANLSDTNFPIFFVRGVRTRLYVVNFVWGAH
jgi:hypothetical protein